MARLRETYDDLKKLETHISNQVAITDQFSKELKVELVFHECDFNIDFIYGKDLLKLAFNNCVFNKKFIVESNIKDADFQNCVFNGKLILRNSEIINKFRMQECSVKDETDFYNVRFNDLADFWKTTFFKVQIFYKVDFLGTTVFSNVTFKENVLFTYSFINKQILFRGTKFEKGLDLSLTILEGQIAPFDLMVDDFETESKQLSEDEYQNYVSTKGIIPIKNKRETFTIIKNQLIKQNNIAESIEYRVLEKETLRNQIKNDLNKNNRVENFFDKIVLWLNKWSNNHGKSYWKGIIFTLIVGSVFFYLSLLSTENYIFQLNPKNWYSDDFRESFKYFFISMNPTHSYNYLDENKPTAWFYFWDFIGRIFIGYGIYQTIQAFRKFR